MAIACGCDKPSVVWMVDPVSMIADTCKVCMECGGVLTVEQMNAHAIENPIQDNTDNEG